MLTIISQSIIGIIDLGAAFLFMYGLKRMSSPVTAPSGIKLAGIGMAVAVIGDETRAHLFTDGSSPVGKTI